MKISKDFSLPRLITLYLVSGRHFRLKRGSQFGGVLKTSAVAGYAQDTFSIIRPNCASLLAHDIVMRKKNVNDFTVLDNVETTISLEVILFIPTVIGTRSTSY